MTLEKAKHQAREESKNGYAQHVNVTASGRIYVSDWFDSDSTIKSYVNGETL